jgi:transposase InsO family protein
MFQFILRLNGTPDDIVSRRGPIFTAKSWRSSASAHRFKLSFSTAYHHQSNGQAERINQVLKQYFGMLINYHQDD